MNGSLPLPSLLAVRTRRAVARTAVRRAAVALAAAVTGVSVTALVRSSDDTAGRWADTRRVVVAEHDLEPGDVISAGAVSLRELPRAAVTDTAAGDVLPLGAVVRYPIAEGEPVVGSRLAPDGLTGVAALVPEGERAVSVPIGPAGAPPVHTGDRVDVVAITADPGDAGEAGAPATPLAEQALVVDATDTTITIAVPATLAPAVAYAASQGLIALTLLGG